MNEDQHLSTVLGPPRTNWRDDPFLLARSTPLSQWTVETAMASRDEEYETEIVATLYRLLEEQQARIAELERQTKAAVPDVACELLRPQA